jgi:hypothetical protein
MVTDYRASAPSRHFQPLLAHAMARAKRTYVFSAAIVLVVVCLYFTRLNPWRWAPEAVIGPYEGASNDFPYVNIFIGTKNGGKLPPFRKSRGILLTGDH